MIGPDLKISCLLRLRPRQWLLRACVLPVCTLLLAVLPVAAVEAAASPMIDPLRESAAQLAPELPAPVIGVARAGDDLFSVGLHGLILRSSDSGKSWEQIPSPVASDLVQVRFRDAQHGWIVGHDSVLLHTSDGGLSWTVQLDGRSLLKLLREVYGQRAASGDLVAQDMLQEISMAMGTSATADVLAAPLLDVLFDDSGLGFVVGAFGMILRSTDDGATWEPWIERTDNDRRMHLYALAEYQGNFFVSGEQGVFMHLDQQAQHFVMVPTPYTGTFFGVRAFSDLLLVHGLRGNLFVSRNQGHDWQKIKTGLKTSLVSALEQGDQLIVVSQSGEMVSLDRRTLQVSRLQAANAGEVYAASATDQPGRLVVTRFSGAKVVEIARAE